MPRRIQFINHSFKALLAITVHQYVQVIPYPWESAGYRITVTVRLIFTMTTALLCFSTYQKVAAYARTFSETILE